MFGDSGSTSRLQFILDYATDPESQRKVVEDAKSTGAQISQAVSAASQVTKNDPIISADDLDRALAMERAFNDMGKTFAGGSFKTFKDLLEAYSRAGDMGGLFTRLTEQMSRAEEEAKRLDALRVNIDSRTGRSDLENPAGTREGFSKAGLDEIYGQQFTQSMREADGATQSVDRHVVSIDTNMRSLVRGARSLSMGINIVAQSAALAGGAILTGMVASANNYAKSSGEINATTEAWAANQKSIANSQEKIGKVAADTLLPVYTAIAGYVAQFATWLEKNPEAATAALDIGAVLIGVGVIGRAVSQGIRLIADIQAATIYLTSSGVMMKASETFAGSAVLMDKAASESALARLGGGVAGEAAGGAAVASGIWAAIGSIATIVGVTLAALGIGSVIGQGFGNTIGKSAYGASWKDQGYGEEWQTFREALATDLGGMLLIEQKLGIVSKDSASNIWGMVTAILGLNKATDQAATSASALTSAQQAEFMSKGTDLFTAYYDKQQSDAVANADAITQIRKDEGAAEQAAAANNAATISQIYQSFTSQMQSLVASHAKAEKDALDAFQSSRAEAIASEGQQEQQAQAQLQQRLQQLQKQHNDKMQSLVMDRDALGVQNEIKSYNEQKKSEIDATNATIAQDRAALSAKLKQEADAYAKSEQQRADDFREQSDAADKQYKQQLAAENAKYAKEVELAKAQEKDKLDKQNKAYTDQQNAQRDALIKQLNDLYYSLDTEAKAKTTAYQNMQADLVAFLDTYRSTLASGISNINGVPTHDYSGYAGTGVYAMAQNGAPEYVLSGSATAQAERILGGRLSESSIMTALLGQGGSSSGSRVVWNDHRRFDGDISEAVRRQNRADTLSIFSQVMK